MKITKNLLAMVFCIVFLLTVTTGIAISSENVTITGTVIDDFRIMTEKGEIYHIAEGKVGDEVVELINQKVKVTGPVNEEEGEKVIFIISYEIIKE